MHVCCMYNVEIKETVHIILLNGLFDSFPFIDVKTQHMLLLGNTTEMTYTRFGEGMGITKIFNIVYRDQKILRYRQHRDI